MLRIGQLRKRKGVSLRELARRAGVGLATLSRIESGEANPRLSTLLQLAEVLGVFVGDLFEKPSRGKGGK
jgi:transcriptional regulator with XRE-family HTH domain